MLEMKKDEENISEIKLCWAEFWTMDERLKVLRRVKETNSFSLHGAPDFAMPIDADSAKAAIAAEIARVKVARRDALGKIKQCASDLLPSLGEM